MKLTLNGTCNSTLEDLRIGSSEEAIAGSLTFHSLGLIIAAGCSLIAILLSFYLIWMHALHYTKPYEQRHIIRILFMVPVYAVSSFLSFWFYWHAIYFEIISSCYEAFAIASFFALLCHYIAPDLHEQKAYFRGITPGPWVLPINWFKKCCGGERGIWRTPRSGLTWFNIIWTGIYQYCFLRVSLTIVAVITQYFGKYCQSSDSPIFAHIWVIVLEGAAVTIAMYSVIQFYIQLRVDLAPHRPFLKVVAIKLVIFLSFWQTFVIDILTSPSLNLISPTKYIAHPDLVEGIPSLLLCIEMAIFAILHLWAFPYRPYTSRGAVPTKYPSDSPLSLHDNTNTLGPNRGGPLGVLALIDAMNPWDMVKGFARGMRWLVVGRKHRELDPSYTTNPNANDMALSAANDTAYKPAEHLPIADEFRRSRFGMPLSSGGAVRPDGEAANLLAHAQPNPINPSPGYYNQPSYNSPPSNYNQTSNYDQGSNYNSPPSNYNHYDGEGRDITSPNIGLAISEPEPYQSHVQSQTAPYPDQSHPTQPHPDQYRSHTRGTPSQQWAAARGPVESAQTQQAPPPPQSQQRGVHEELWGAGGRQENQF